jgi:hypothetical protein
LKGKAEEDVDEHVEKQGQCEEGSAEVNLDSD